MDRSIPLSRALTALVCGSATFAYAGLQVQPGFTLQYQVDGVFLSGIDAISDTELLGGTFTATQDLHRVALHNGPVGPALYTQPTLPGGPTFAGGWVASNGTYGISGQTGSTNPQGLFNGRVFLTNLADGSSSALDVPGNFDGASAGGEFYLNAAAGTASGLIDNASSGIYALERSGGTLTGLNLILDTGAPSGVLTGDAAGNLAFALGGPSALLAGNTRDLYRLSAADVAAGASDGPTVGLAPSAADKLITGTAMAAVTAPFFATQVPAGGSIFSSISDMVFTADGDLIVGISGFVFDSNFDFVGTIGQTLLLDVVETGGDYSATVAATLYTNDTDGAGSLAYRASDNTLWVSTNGNLYGIVVPEPAAAVLAMIALAMLPRRRSHR